MYFKLTQTFYILAHMFSKLSFLSLYYKIFTLPRFQIACQVLMALSVDWDVSFVLRPFFNAHLFTESGMERRSPLIASIQVGRSKINFNY